MLKKLAISFLSAVALLGVAPDARAFSLLGQLDASYQTADLGYSVGIIISSREQDLGGPMNLDEEYRWSSPILVYGFDTTFKEYFGEQGVAAVEAAIKIFNDLPSASDMSPTLAEWPLETGRFNYTAQELRIIDIKSLVLSCLLEQMGLACPERYAFTIFQRIPLVNLPGQFSYTVIQRNYDPVPINPTAAPNRWRYAYSPYVNETLYTYITRHIRAFNNLPEFWDAQEIAVDAASPRVSVIASTGLQAGPVDPRIFAQVYGLTASPGAGRFYTGLTRDDVGGLRYLLNPGRTNVESAPLGSTRGVQVSGPQISLIGGTPPWTIPFPGILIGTNATTVTNTVTPLLDPAMRGGADKVTFVRLDVDSFLGRFLNPLVIRYPETVVDPLTLRPFTQTVQRQLAFPDIIFTAADLGAAPNTGEPYVFSRALGFLDNSVLNSGGRDAHAGPGNVLPGEITLNKVGPWSINEDSFPAQEDGIKGFIFGTFDGTTNAPVVFPEGVDIYELERKVLGRN